MSAHALVWWVVLAAVVVVLALSVVQLAHAVGGLKQLGGRVEAYADLPVVAALGRAERDVQRLADALERVQPLTARAAAALEVIRRGPVPPEMKLAFRRTASGVALVRDALRLAREML